MIVLLKRVVMIIVGDHPMYPEYSKIKAADTAAVPFDLSTGLVLPCSRVSIDDLWEAGASNIWKLVGIWEKLLKKYGKTGECSMICLQKMGIYSIVNC